MISVPLNKISVLEEIEKLSKFPKIQFNVQESYGTVRLKIYLEKLLSDTRDCNRSGFPIEVSEALIAISLANMDYIEDIGISFEDDPVSQFTVTGWELPKNF